MATLFVLVGLSLALTSQVRAGEPTDGVLASVRAGGIRECAGIRKCTTIMQDESPCTLNWIECNGCTPKDCIAAGNNCQVNDWFKACHVVESADCTEQPAPTGCGTAPKGSCAATPQVIGTCTFGGATVTNYRCISQGCSGSSGTLNCQIYRCP